MKDSNYSCADWFRDCITLSQLCWVYYERCSVTTWNFLPFVTWVLYPEKWTINVSLVSMVTGITKNHVLVVKTLPSKTHYLIFFIFTCWLSTLLTFVHISSFKKNQDFVRGSHTVYTFYELKFYQSPNFTEHESNKQQYFKEMGLV